MNHLLVFAIYWIDADDEIVPVAVLDRYEYEYPDVSEKAYVLHILFSGNIVSNTDLCDFTTHFSVQESYQYNVSANLLLLDCYNDSTGIYRLNKVDLFVRAGGQDLTIFYASLPGVVDERGRQLPGFYCTSEHYIMFPAWASELMELKMLVSYYSYARNGTFSIPTSYRLDAFMYAYLADRQSFQSAENTSYGTTAQMMTFYDVNGLIIESTKAHTAQEFFDEFYPYLANNTRFYSLGVGIFVSGSGHAENYRFGLILSPDDPYSGVGPILPALDFVPLRVSAYRDRVLVIYGVLLDESATIAKQDFNVASRLQSAFIVGNCLFLRVKKLLGKEQLIYTPTSRVLACESEHAAAEFSSAVDVPAPREEIEKEQTLFQELNTIFPALQPLSPEFSAVAALIAQHANVWAMHAAFRDFARSVFKSVDFVYGAFELLFLSDGNASSAISSLRGAQYAEYTHACVNYSSQTREYLVVLVRDAKERAKIPNNAWKVAGIVLGTLSCIAIAAVAVFLLYRYKQRSAYPKLSQTARETVSLDDIPQTMI